MSSWLALPWIIKLLFEAFIVVVALAAVKAASTLWTIYRPGGSNRYLLDLLARPGTQPEDIVRAALAGHLVAAREIRAPLNAGDRLEARRLLDLADVEFQYVWARRRAAIGFMKNGATIGLGVAAFVLLTPLANVNATIEEVVSWGRLALLACATLATLHAFLEGRLRQRQLSWHYAHGTTQCALDQRSDLSS